MLVGGQKPVPEAMGNSPDEKMDTESTNGVELCRVSLEVAKVASEVKKKAKSIAGNSLYVNQRALTRADFS